jgi:two-component system OmpR family response regulator
VSEVSGQESEESRVLVVDDEFNIADLVSKALRFEGFVVATGESGSEAIAGVMDFRPRLLVLDVMLPDIDGFEVAERLAASGHNVPTIFLTAKDTIEDKIRGLTLGGDDYVTKPFSVEELIARVNTILRRVGGGAKRKLNFADLTLDEETHEVFRGGRPIPLTETEFRLLRFLMSRPRSVHSRAEILDQVWHYDFGGDARILETYISYLRKKIDADHPPLLHTVRSVGYALREPRN